jgi:aryl-alcohol dehydrogenase-like predicted oxidoreductase
VRSKERRALMAAALDAGFTHFDTARMYGEGLAERSLGDFMAGGLRQRVTLATKFGFAVDSLGERVPAAMYVKRAVGSIARRTGLAAPPTQRRQLSPAAAEESLTRSLRALRTDWVDILFVHEPQAKEIGELHALAEWLRAQKANGRARWLGLSGLARDCVTIAQELSGVFDVLQVEDSLAGREADILSPSGWPMQMTYGYLRHAKASSAEPEDPAFDSHAVVRAALARNAHGMVLVSTRKADRIRTLVLAERAERP